MPPAPQENGASVRETIPVKVPNIPHTRQRASNPRVYAVYMQEGTALLRDGGMDRWGYGGGGGGGGPGRGGSAGTAGTTQRAAASESASLKNSKAGAVDDDDEVSSVGKRRMGDARSGPCSLGQRLRPLLGR